MILLVTFDYYKVVKAVDNVDLNTCFTILICSKHHQLKKMILFLKHSVEKLRIPSAISPILVA